MGNCISQCTSGEDDQYHRSSSEPSGHLSNAHSTTHRDGTTTANSSMMRVSFKPSEHCSPACAASAEVCTIDTTISMVSVMPGPCSASHLTSAKVSVCPEPSGPSCLASAEVETILSMAAATQESSGPYRASRLTSAEVSDCPETSGPSCLASAEVETILSMAAATQESSGPYSASYLTSAEVSDCPETSGPSCLASAETILSMAAATQESSGPCSASHLTSAEVSDCPETSGPSCLASAEVEIILSMAAATQESSGPYSASHLTSAEVSDCPETSGPSCLALAEVETTLGMAAAAQESSGPCSPGTPDTIPSRGSIFPGPMDMMTTGCDMTINLSSFILHHVLGAGSFGKVVLATHRRSQQKVAIKSVIKTHDDYEIQTERYVLEMASGCPFLTQLYATFQTRFSACFIMEYVCGGNLLHLLIDYSPLDNDTIKFIVAETSCGLEFLHSRGILHRDIKPDNILMDGSGHVRIADYGLAIAYLSDDEIATGFAGTIGYMAPEVINNDVYQFEPDWFSLGVVTYVMATELRPFRCRTFNEYKREVNFRHPVYPPHMDPDLEDFIKGLLCKYPDERLGVGEDIRSHPFLDSIDWEELEKGKTPPPFPVDPPMDVEIRTRLPPSALHQHPESSHLPDEEVYIPGFTYVSNAWACM